MSMPETRGNATPTDAERQQARDYWRNARYDDSAPDTEDVIAQALADQRAKYEAVADYLARDAWNIMGNEASRAKADAADRIRRVTSA